IRVGTTSHHEAEWLQTSREVILDELNIKQLEVIEDPTQVASPEVVPNMLALGPRLGAQAKEVAAALRDLDPDTARALAFGETVQVAGVELCSDDVQVRMQPTEEGSLVAAQGHLVVALDPHIDDDLRAEGMARDLVNRIQRMRKELDLPVEARINVGFQDAAPEIVAAVEANLDIVEGETLSKISTDGIATPEITKEHSIDGLTVTVEISRVA
ncbi:MAG TPA: DUF5915 domain-containing protein, partial [Acidobacteriota bacterium]|nr:DUF5915 domain-containing protein [Acidobacteriota bacterium]